MIHRIFSASVCNLMFLQTRCEMMIFLCKPLQTEYFVDSNYQRNPAIITLFLYEYYFSSTNTTFPLRAFHWKKKTQNFSKFLKISQNLSKSLKISQNLRHGNHCNLEVVLLTGMKISQKFSQNLSKSLKISQNLSKSLKIAQKNLKKIKSSVKSKKPYIQMVCADNCYLQSILLVMACTKDVKRSTSDASRPTADAISRPPMHSSPSTTADASRPTADASRYKFI